MLWRGAGPQEEAQGGLRAVSQVTAEGLPYFAGMRDMSHFLVQVGLRAAVNQVTAEGLLHEWRILLCEAPGR